MHAMAQRLDVLEWDCPVITVAGTNGKGTTCLALEHILQAHGYQVGTTLSPHIDRFNERIRVSGQELDDRSICEAFEVVDRARDDFAISYFEFCSLAALQAFKMANVDVVVLEIGLGGRLDAFNVIDADVAVITSIGLDHQDYLGDTLEAIGTEKAGILRAGQAVILGPEMPSTVLARCEELDIDPDRLGKQVRAKFNGALCTVESDDGLHLTDLDVPHASAQNFVLGLLAARYVTQVDNQRVREVAATFSVRGRMQFRTIEGRQWVFDVAHNPAAALFLVEELRRRDLRPAVCICGLLRDKDHVGVIEAVSEFAPAQWLFVDTLGERGQTGQALAAKLSGTALEARLNHRTVTLARDDSGDQSRCCEPHDPEPAFAQHGVGEGNTVDAPLDTSEFAAERAWVQNWVRSATREGDVILAFGSFTVVERLS